MRGKRKEEKDDGIWKKIQGRGKRGIGEEGKEEVGTSLG